MSEEKEQLDQPVAPASEADKEKVAASMTEVASETIEVAASTEVEATEPATDLAESAEATREGAKPATSADNETLTETASETTTQGAELTDGPPAGASQEGKPQPQATKKNGPKVFYTGNDPQVGRRFPAEATKARQQNWQRFEPDPDEYKHNIFPDYFYAGFWIRFWAFLADLLCIGAITNSTIGLAYRVTTGANPSGNFLSFYGLSSLVIYVAYFTLLTKLNHGQTIGKMLFGIRVVSLKESELSWTTVILRETVCRFILKYPLLMLGYLPAAFSKRKQHVGDFFCDTSVVTLNMISAFNKEITAEH